MKITAEPRSDQINADDLIGGPQTVTVKAVHLGKAEQKYDIEIVETPGRAWRPPVTVLRLLIAAWGDDAANWAGKRATIYRDESVTFGPDAVGGIRVSHVSGIDKPLTERVTTKRGRRSLVTIQPLTESSVTPVTPALSDRIESAVIAFEGLSVSREQLAGFVGKPETEWTAADLDGLVAAFQSLQAGTMTVGEMLGGDA